MGCQFPPELQQLVQQGLAAGQYQSEDEMLLEAIRLLQHRDSQSRRFQENLEARLKRLDRGETIELDDDDALRKFFDDVQHRGTQRYEATRNAR